MLGVLVAAALCPAQGPSRQERIAAAIELLTMQGSKSDLSASGDGITSVKVNLLFKLGPTSVVRTDPDFKIRLPVGHKLFNDLAYTVGTEAVTSGPNAIVFKLPSAKTKEVFDTLRILQATVNEAEPDKPRWSDITVPSTYSRFYERYFTKAEFEELIPDFVTRTLRGTSERLGTFVVAVKDSSLARDNFSADVGVTATTTPEAVKEGNEVRYSYKIVNDGPDVASEVYFHSYFDPRFVSFSSSQGTCQYGAGNLYCSLGEMAKGASSVVTLTAKCPWGVYVPGQEPALSTSFEVEAAEQDPNYENNMRHLSVPILLDPNKGPEVKILSPVDEQLLVGPNPTMNLVAEAHDPDGRVSKVEFFDQGVSIGVGKPTQGNRFELTYEKAPLGRHWLTAMVTDDQGRESSMPASVYFVVNGTVRVEITNPKVNATIRYGAEGITASVQATNPTGPIKHVMVHLFQRGGGQGFTQEAVLKGKNEYVTTFKNIPFTRDCRLQAHVEDESGVETLSEPINVIITHPPQVMLLHNAQGSAGELQSGTVFDSSSAVEVIANAISIIRMDVTIVRIEFYVDDKLVCTDVNTRETNPYFPYRSFRCKLPSLTPGKHVLTAAATDGDGTTGKSAPVEIVIR